MTKFSPGYGVMEKKQFGVPADNVGYSEDLERAKEIADGGPYRWVVEMWKEDGVWHFGEEMLYRSFFWPGRQAIRRVREG